MSGLTADGLILQNNGGDNLTLNSGASSFTFPAPLADGASYNVTRFRNANNLNCTTAGGSGTVSGGNVTSVAVSCGPADYATLFSAVSSAGLPGVEQGSISFGDADGDGDLDLVITGVDSGINRIARLYRNDGAGNFTDASAGLTPVDISSSSFGDADGDGDLDLVIAGRDSGFNILATLYTNDGAGNFTDASAGLTGAVFGSTSFGDVDGDGDLDLLITGEDSGGVESARLYTNDGAGNFTGASGDLTQVVQSSSDFGDVDGDGDLDLVITGFTGLTGTAILYTNDGAGDFTAASAGLTGVQSGSSRFGDVDGDGDLDLVITGRDNGSNPAATLYTNDGAGNFTNASAGLTGVRSFSSSSFGDVDRDGDLDLVITGRNSGGAETATLYINDGAGNFTAASAGLTGVHLSSVSFGDVDGDGDPDLVITGADSGDDPTTTFYRNALD